MKMLLTGDSINAKYAKEIGLINDHYPIAKLDNEVIKLAKKIASKSNQELLHAIIINIYKTYDIIKTLNYYLANMSKNNNEVKYYNILEYIAISYRHIAPTLPKLKILYQIN